jgi:hypothetical protein
MFREIRQDIHQALCRPIFGLKMVASGHQYASVGDHHDLRAGQNRQHREPTVRKNP